MARILIVEDMAIIALDLQDTVEELGHEVVGVASSVDDALAKIEEIAPAPDVVMLDANLRGLSAAPVAESLRGRAIPFVICSGYGDEILQSVGTDEPRLAKPFGKSQLEQEIAKLTASPAASRPHSVKR